MKVVLFALNSSYIHTNPAVRSISLSLTDNGIDNKIIERNLKDKRDLVLYDLYAENADIYGFSAYIWNIDAMLSLSYDLKELIPSCKIVFGGPEVSYDTAVLKHIDCVISGEGEEAWAELCKMDHIPKYIAGRPFGNFTDSGILYDKIPNMQGDMLYYESSRGCPYKCSYCLSSVTDGIRAKSAEKTLEDLLEFEKLNVNIHVIKFVDRTFNFNRQRAKQIWRGLMSDSYTKKYHFEICAELLDEESFEILAGMPKGKMQLEIGVQSTNYQTLNAISRHSDIDKVLSSLERLKSAGNIHIHADLIAGLPYEDYDMFKKSFDDVYGKCDLLQLGFLKLLKGTPLRTDAEKYGIKFSHSAPYTVLCSKWLSYSDITKLRKIESVLDRYSKLESSMKYITSHCISPFEFFESFAENINTQLTAVSQIKAYELLYSYASAHYNFEPEILRAWLRFDFLRFENGACPLFLSPDRADGSALKSEFISECRRENIDIFVPALEAHKFEFDKENIYFIDRKNSRVYKNALTNM